MRKKTLKKRTRKGGKSIGAGGYGCIFNPSLKCKGSSVSPTKKMVSKLMETEYVEAEYNDIQKFSKQLTKIPNYSDYFLINGVSMCQPEKLSTSDLVEYDDVCSNLVDEGISANVINDNEVLRQLKIINMPFGGVDVKDYLLGINLNTQKIIAMNNALMKLLKNGILPMNSRGVYHCDVKDSNILIEDDVASGKIYARLIDWGLSYMKSPTLIKDMGRRPFQYNMPFSVIMFHENFKTAYQASGSPQTKETIFPFLKSYIDGIIKKRGLGHVSTMHHINQILFNKPNESINYTMNIMYTYITKILLRFGANMERYLPIYLKNVDLWGFCITQTSVACEYAKKKVITTRDIKCIDVVKQLYEVLLDHADTEIPVIKIEEIMNSLSNQIKNISGRGNNTKYYNIARGNIARKFIEENPLSPVRNI